MAFKRALVVDDSRSARVALKKLLDEHDLDVEFAVSGEEALEFLDRELVDVVFMDHHMPGMDGLEAVAAIKRNPRTATIPVMMYTTREGEVYVSQARALGAVGVLPKQVQPGVLFNMLLDLGLVQERRDSDSEASEIIPKISDKEDSTAAEAETDRILDDHVLGVSMQSIVTRILEDQHLALRADILRGNREFARQVATEILEQNQSPVVADDPELDAEMLVSTGKTYSQRTVTVLVLVLLVPVLVVGGLYLKATEERERAEINLVGLDRSLEERLQIAEAVTTEMLVDMNQERATSQAQQLAALTWSLNEGSHFPFTRQAFDLERSQQLQSLLTHLQVLEFKGTVRLIAHLGEFCLQYDSLGTLSPAVAELPIEQCTTIGHPLDGSTFVDERQSPEFQAFMDIRAEAAQAITIELVANDRYSSVRRHPYPDTVNTAGGWNEVATRNNRVEFELIARD